MNTKEKRYVVTHYTTYDESVTLDSIMDEIRNAFNLANLQILFEDSLNVFIDADEVEELVRQVFSGVDAELGWMLTFDQWSDRDLNIILKKPNETRQLEKRIDELMGRLALAKLAIDKSDMNGLLYNLNQALES